MLNASLSLPGARLVPVSLVMRPAIRPFCTRHWGACDLSVRVCATTSVYSRYVCVCVLLPICLKTRPVCEARGKQASTMYSLAHYDANALCFLSTCLCQTRGALFSPPGLGGPNLVRLCPGTAHQEFSSTHFCWPHPPFSPSALACRRDGKTPFTNAEWFGSIGFRYFWYNLENYSNVLQQWKRKAQGSLTVLSSRHFSDVNPDSHSSRHILTPGKNFSAALSNTLGSIIIYEGTVVNSNKKHWLGLRQQNHKMSEGKTSRLSWKQVK